MTVKELKAFLDVCPDDMLVLSTAVDMEMHRWWYGAPLPLVGEVHQRMEGVWYPPRPLNRRKCIKAVIL